MKTQLITVERRQHTREGVMAEIEDITYRVLRKYGVNAPTPPKAGEHGGERSA